VDVAVRIYERDRENFGSVLGSLLLVAGGVIATAWAGRNLAITLTAASANAWRIPRPGGMTSPRAVGVVIALLSAVLVFAGVLRLIHDSPHLILVATSIVAIFVAYAAAWFALTLVLPRATRDPTSLLPGAALTGVTFAGLSWISQFYLVPRLDTGSELLGGLGLTAVALGWLFIASRIMVAGLVVNAVLYEQYGSLLDLLLSLPVLRRLRRYQWIRQLLEDTRDR
jgi:uncharacterized BrkB/YihY/UPF0761 family membrane protein